MLTEVRNWLKPWYNKFAVIALSTAIGFAGYEYIRWSGLTASDWGTWTGAICTVATLAVTVRIATSEQRRRIRNEKDLALVTLTGLIFRIEIVKQSLNTIVVMMQADIRQNFASDYVRMSMLIAQCPIWKPEELVPLVGIPDHLAPRLAYAAAEIEGLRIAFEMVAASTHFQDPTVSTNFNVTTLPRLESPIEVLHDARLRCRAYVDQSGFGGSSVTA